ncbi:MAG: transporter substrate-binding domain-containing protein, partial [Pseudolabrys sp.]
YGAAHGGDRRRHRRAVMRVAAQTLGIALLTSPIAFADDIAPTGTLRAVYLAGNPAQAVRGPSGEIRGASADLARELARRLNVPLALMPSENPATVIEAVAKGEADIGFVAFAPERVGAVEFSQVYMLVEQTFVVPDNSRIKSVADIDTDGLRISSGKGDSITLYLKRKVKHATLVETDNTPADAKKKLLAGEADAFGANRQRLTNLLKDLPGYHLLPDSLFGVPQTIIVGKGKTGALTSINQFIDDVRASGFLKMAIKKSGVIGLEAAAAGSWTPSVAD